MRSDKDGGEPTDAQGKTRPMQLIDINLFGTRRGSPAGPWRGSGPRSVTQPRERQLDRDRISSTGDGGTDAQDLTGEADVGQSQPTRVARPTSVGSAIDRGGPGPGDPPRPGPPTSSRSLERLHRPRPYCAGGERSTSPFPGERRQRVAPGYSQSGGARAVTEAESGFGEASCLRRSLCHGLRSDRVPGLFGTPAPGFLAPFARA
jgi:hypothetical protein